MSPSRRGTAATLKKKKTTFKTDGKSNRVCQEPPSSLMCGYKSTIRRRAVCFQAWASNSRTEATAAQAGTQKHPDLDCLKSPSSGRLFFSCLLILAKADTNRLPFVPCVYFCLPPHLPPGLQSSIWSPDLEKQEGIGNEIEHGRGRSASPWWTVDNSASFKEEEFKHAGFDPPPAEIISLSVLGSHKETLPHPTGCVVNGGLCL